MLDITITRKDMSDIANYIEHKGLVEHMNKAGLSFGAMAFILTAIEEACNTVLDKMNEGE